MVALTALVALGPVPGATQQDPPAQQDPPQFRSTVELTPIDVTVVDDRGRPVTDLKAEDFVVRIDGATRRIVSAEWVTLATPVRPAGPPPPEGYSSNDVGTGGRLIVIVIDQLNIRFGGMAGIRNAVNGFIDRLEPSDRAAVVGIGPGSVNESFTADRARLKAAVNRMAGQQVGQMSQYNIAVSEAVEMQNGRPATIAFVVNRECADVAGDPILFMVCASSVEAEAQRIALEGFNDGEQTLRALRYLLDALKALDAPKTLIFVSEGFLLGNRNNDVLEIGALAAAARTSIYTLKLDDSLFPLSGDIGRVPTAPAADRRARAEGLELLAAASRGSLFTLIGTGGGVLDRIASELSGYYVLAVESADADKDGRVHPVRVDVSRRGVAVRSRRAVVATPESLRLRTARESVFSALATPLPVSGLPMRVATFSLQGPETGKVQLLIHADVGADYSSPRAVALGYVITDGQGRIVENRAADARLLPVMNGVPSPLQFAGGASLPPGEYHLKMAIAEGDRVGTVEHPLRAGLVDAGRIKLSDLMVGGPSGTDATLVRPTVGHSVFFGRVHGYVEAYGEGAGELKARYEIASSGDAEPILSDEVSPVMAGPARAIFTSVMPVRQLPPGKYVLRVTFASGDATVKSLRRSFEVARPPVLMTSASAAGAAAPAPSDVYLPLNDALLSRAFNRADVSRRATVQAFRERVAPAARSAFDRGVAFLTAGEYARAEETFKRAIDVESDSSPLIAYLAATFAAAGHDQQAAGAWHTSLINGSDLPQIYEWLADTLMRTRELAEARAILEEAIAKWPADSRFAKQLALVYATFGRGREAARALERYLADHPNDVDAVFLAIEWMYHLHAAGAVVHSPAEDLKRVVGYAEAYRKARGPQTALVKQWVEFLQQETEPRNPGGSPTPK
jgi:VWFA-related protein